MIEFVLAKQRDVVRRLLAHFGFAVRHEVPVRPRIQPRRIRSLDVALEIRIGERRVPLARNAPLSRLQHHEIDPRRFYRREVSPRLKERNVNALVNLILRHLRRPPRK